jgi:predicted ABC-type transport system involved in lysophospholipase L1 biosynthesis ATPase subunit
MNSDPGKGKDTPVLSATGIERTFAVSRTEVRALRGVSLEIHAGETVSIMGASGAGKSTLLHILGGLDRPSAGQVLLRGRDLYAMSPLERTDIRATDFGFVFQSYYLLPELDVVENVVLPAMTPAGAGRHRGRLRERALELLDRVGLADRASHRPTELSGGEQQRVALARALMNRPEIILADEPTGNLDSATGNQVLEYLFSIVRENHHTLALVTHNESVAARCGRELVLHDGRLAL